MQDCQFYQGKRKKKQTERPGNQCPMMNTKAQKARGSTPTWPTRNFRFWPEFFGITFDVLVITAGRCSGRSEEQPEYAPVQITCRNELLEILLPAKTNARCEKENTSARNQHDHGLKTLTQNELSTLSADGKLRVSEEPPVSSRPGHAEGQKGSTLHRLSVCLVSLDRI